MKIASDHKYVGIRKVEEVITEEPSMNMTLDESDISVLL
jgi:hypothetical protein